MKNSLTIAIITITIAVLPSACGDGVTDSGSSTNRNYRQEMRDFVKNISTYAKGINPDFIIIPQNGLELLTQDGEETGAPARNYLNAIDGVGREDLFYGYDGDDTATPAPERDYMIAFLDIAEKNGIEALVTDYCRTQSFIDDSYAQNAARGYVSFAADDRELNTIPPYPAVPYHVNSSDVASLSEAKNFLYLLDSHLYSSKEDFLKAMRDTDYDIVLIDLFFNGTEELNAADIASLKLKSGGGSRLVIGYMSIGEAEDYRDYWRQEWTTNPPSWLAEENPEWPGNYKVRYWDKNWQNIIFGNANSYLKKILDAGFNGAYLDIIDAFEYFEGQ